MNIRKYALLLLFRHANYIQSGKLLTVVPISSQIENPAELDILIEEDLLNLSEQLTKLRW